MGFQKKNNGKSEDDILKNTFTSYIGTALKRARNSYILTLERIQEHEHPLEGLEEISSLWEYADFDVGLPYLDQIDNEELVELLLHLSEMERKVFLMKTLGDITFEQIAALLNISYHVARHTYYRCISKMKTETEDRRNGKTF